MCPCMYMRIYIYIYIYYMHTPELVIGTLLPSELVTHLALASDNIYLSRFYSMKGLEGKQA